MLAPSSRCRCCSLPGSPRWQPPPKLPLGLRVGLVLAIAVPLCAVIIAGDTPLRTVAEAHWELALGSDSARLPAHLAYERARSGDWDAAVTFYRVAWALDPDSDALAAALAVALSNDGQCQEAAAIIDDLEPEEGGAAAATPSVRTALESARHARRACIPRD